MNEKFDYTKSVALFRDEFVPFRDAHVSIASSPVLYGLAVYTVFNVMWEAESGRYNIFRLRDHWQRLCSSARIMDFANFAESHPYEQFESKMAELLHRNNIQENVLVRASIFIDELIAGTRIHGLKNSFSAYVYPLGDFYHPEGIHVCVSSFVRTPDNAMPARAKVNGSYVNAALMKNEALKNGFDDALALDSLGHLTEGTVANVFLVRGDRLITPAVSGDLLEGITRDSVMQLARLAGMQVEARAVDRSELYIADEVFVTGSSAQLTPVLSVDRRPVGSGAVGPVAQRLGQLYKDARLGKLPEFTDWVVTV
jgi:branched-chain amino acid aminotransferase